MPSPAATQTSSNPDAGCTRAARALVEAHFNASITPDGERRLRAHLERCDDCRASYERHLLLSKLDPSSTSVEARLAVGLGLRPQRRAMPLPLFGGVALAAAAMVALVVAAPFRGARDDGSSEFQARGSAPAVSEPARLGVFRVEGAGARSLLGADERVAPGGELAFSYTNRDAKKYLLVFASDERGHVYWYYPAWTDPKAPPSAVPIERTDAPRPLPDAVSHDFDARRVQLVAVFTDEPLSVTDVEARLSRAGGKVSAFTLPNAVIERRTLELSP